MIILLMIFLPRCGIVQVNYNPYCISHQARNVTHRQQIHHPQHCHCHLCWLHLYLTNPLHLLSQHQSHQKHLQKVLHTKPYWDDSRSSSAILPGITEKADNPESIGTVLAIPKEVRDTRSFFYKKV